MKEEFEILWIAPHHSDDVARCAKVKRINIGDTFHCQIAKPIGAKNKDVVIHPCEENFVPKQNGAPAMCDNDKEYKDLCIGDILISQV